MATIRAVVFLLFLISVGLTGCGGGGGGSGGDSNSGSSNDTDTTTGTDTSGVDLQLKLAQDDYWEFYWFNDRTSFAQGSGASSSSDFGTFRVTLGASINAAGLVAFPLIVTGDPGQYDPRWTHVALNADGSLLGSTDGANFEVIFDITSSAWNGGGFFHDFGDNPVSISPATLSGEYNTVNALKLGYADSSGGCETILGFTICDDTSTSFSFNEYHKEGVGPVGFRQDSTFTSSGGNFFTSTTIRNTVELIETSESAIDMTAFNRPDWEEMAPLNTARDNHAAVALNGKIYVLGGFDSNNNSLNSMEIYDPVQNQWSVGPGTPTTTFGEAHVINGRIYIQSTSANQVLVYDPAVGWSTVPVSTSGGSFGASDTYFDTVFGLGDIIIGVNGTTPSDAELDVTGYQPSGNTWIVGNGLPIRELLRPSVTIVGDTMYVIGGFGGRTSCNFFNCDRGALDWVLKYDLTTDVWDTVSAAEMSTERDNLQTVELNGKIIALGGNPVGCSSSSCSIGSPLRSAETYDPAANSWSNISSMLVPRKDFAAVVLNGDLYAIGGYDGADETARVERYRP